MTVLFELSVQIYVGAVVYHLKFDLVVEGIVELYDRRLGQNSEIKKMLFKPIIEDYPIYCLIEKII